MFDCLKVAQITARPKHTKRLTIRLTNCQKPLPHEHNAWHWLTRTQNHIIRIVSPCEKIDDNFIYKKPFKLTEKKFELLLERPKQLNH